MTAPKPSAGDDQSGAESQRLDKWLWCARFFKSRGLATKLLSGGKLRLTGKVVTKGHQLVRTGDVLTFPQGHSIRVVRVLFLADRRGPAPEAQTLYEDLAPLEQKPASGAPASDDGQAKTSPVRTAKPARRDPGDGRPTKRDRRAVDKLMDRD